MRSTFNDGSGSDIFQLVSIDSVLTYGTRGKEWAVASKNNKTNFNFITVIFPFAKYDDRIDEEKTSPDLKGWKINKSKFTFEGAQATSLTKGDQSVFFSIKKLELNKLKIIFSEKADVFLKLESNKLSIQSLNTKGIQLEINGVKENGKVTLVPGKELHFTLKQ